MVQAGTESEDDAHPVDQLILKKLKHTKEVADVQKQQIEVDNNSDNEGADVMDATAGKKSRLSAAASAPPSLRGITLVDDVQEITANNEMRRLIRAPRYFDDDAGDLVPDASMRCFNCGQVGHRAIDCTNAARLRPCHLCAQLGHDARDCPNRLCFKCGRPGHVSRDCTRRGDSWWESAITQCLRCGSESCACAGKGDYFRYEGGCTSTYAAEDLRLCRCYVCGKHGHLCCKPTPREPAARVSCYCCGATGHLGESCPEEDRPHLAAERAGDVRRATAEREAEYERLAAAASVGRDRSAGRGGFDRGGGGGGGGFRSQHRYLDDDDDDYNVRRGGGGGGDSRRSRSTPHSAHRPTTPRFHRYADDEDDGRDSRRYDHQRQGGQGQQQHWQGQGQQQQQRGYQPQQYQYAAQQQPAQQQYSYQQQQQRYHSADARSQQRDFYGQQQQYSHQQQQQQYDRQRGGTYVSGGGGDRDREPGRQRGYGQQQHQHHHSRDPLGDSYQAELARQQALQQQLLLRSRSADARFYDAQPSYQQSGGGNKRGRYDDGDYDRPYGGGGGGGKAARRW